jgi:hypothetical protein
LALGSTYGSEEQTRTLEYKPVQNYSKLKKKLKLALL